MIMLQMHSSFGSLAPALNLGSPLPRGTRNHGGSSLVCFHKGVEGESDWFSLEELSGRLNRLSKAEEEEERNAPPPQTSDTGGR